MFQNGTARVFSSFSKSLSAPTNIYLNLATMGSVGEDPVQQTPQGPPPFEPPLALLTLQAAAIDEAIDDYASSSTKDDKARAITKLAHASQRLATASASPGIMMQRFAFQPVANAAVRVAIGMGLFNQLPPPGESASTKQLAAKCKSDPEFVQRIARAVTSLGMLDEVSEETYAHTPISLILSDDTAQASLARTFHRST
jgi:hypothetical protein